MPQAPRIPCRSCLPCAALIIALSGLVPARATEPSPASQPADPRVIADFGYCVRAAGGGLFQVVGGRPDVVRDQLLACGDPPARAWRIDALPGAPAEGVGGVVPLFDNLAPAKAQPTRVDAAPFLEIRLTGVLKDRRLNVEVCPAVGELDQVGAVIGSVTAAEVDAQQWRTIVLPMAAKGVKLPAAAAIRLMFAGEGPAWVAVDWMRWCDSATPAPWTPPQPSAPPSIRQALWVWETKEIWSDPARTQGLLDFARKHDLTDLFCQVQYDYADGVAALELADAQRAFLAAAHRARLKIHALDGFAEYVLPENHERMFQLVAALDRFNHAGPADARYDALHLDNEPYLVPAWKDPATRQSVIDAYVSLNQELRHRANAAGLEFGVDIPFWFDQYEASGAPKFAVETAAGKTSLLEALFGCVQNAGIMSYRERVTGRNGVVALCATEFDLGARLGVDVFASVEVGVGPRVEQGITFGVYPLQYFREQRATLLPALGCEKGCRGLAIHHYRELRAWEERP